MGSQNSSLNLGWNGGAISIAVKDGNLELSFSVPTSAAGVVCGLGCQSLGVGFEEIDYALYSSHGSVQVIERGVVLTSVAAHSSSDVLSITRRRGQVRYHINGTVLYASTAPSAGPLFADASLYAAGDCIVGAALTELPEGMVSAGSLRPVGGAAADKASGTSAGMLLALGSESSNKALASSRGQLPFLGSSSSKGVSGSSEGKLIPISGSGTAATRGSSAAVLLPLNARGDASPGGFSHASLTPLSGEASASVLKPKIAMSDGVLAPVTGISAGTTGGMVSSEAFLPGLQSRSSDRGYGESAGTLSPLRGFSAESVYYLSYAVLTMPGQFVLSGPSYADLVLRGPFKLIAKARSGKANSVDVAAPASALFAFSGAVSQMNAPKALLSIGGAIHISGRAALRMPAPKLAASGTAIIVGEAALRAPPAPVLKAFGGATARMAAPHSSLAGEASENVTGTMRGTLRGTPAMRAFAGAVLTQRLSLPSSLSASGHLAGRADAALSMPSALLRAEGSVLGWGGARLTMPTPQLTTARTAAELVMRLPRLRADGVLLAHEGFEAWAFNIADPDASDGPQARVPQYEATHYTNFPFERIVRFGGAYYGIGRSGLYRLGGDTDAGKPVAWAFETHISDFGSPQLKALAAVYLDAKLGAQAIVSAVVGEEEEHSYQYTNVRGSAVQNHRVRFGRGMRSRHYGIRIEDGAGDPLRLDSIDLELSLLTRRI